MGEFQTYLKDCDCKGAGVIHFKKKIHCRWCRKPYAKGGMIQYQPEHFDDFLDMGVLNKKVNVSFKDFDDYRNKIMSEKRVMLFEDLMKGFFQSKISKTTP